MVGWSTLALKRRAPGIVTALAALLLIAAGWSEPADPEHPNDQSKNRRVEIVILGGGK